MDRGLKIASLAYHDVTDDPSTSGLQRPGALPYKLGWRAFRAHLDALGAGPCTPTLVCDVPWTRAGRHLLLTFDDGGKSALSTGEELCRRGWRGHFFIVTSRIGTRTFLDASEIRHLRSCGHVVGSHSHTHPDIFRAQTPHRMAEEWRVSCAILGTLLGEQCVTASVPGGDISAAVLRSGANAGLRYLFTSEPRLGPGQADECWVLGRFTPKVGSSPHQVARLARFRGWTRARAVREIKVFARVALAPLYRWHVARQSRESAPSAAESGGPPVVTAVRR